MDEIIGYKMCAVKVRNAKLRNYLNTVFSTFQVARMPNHRTSTFKQILTTIRARPCRLISHLVACTKPAHLPARHPPTRV
jgi:hypothetical protein